MNDASERAAKPSRSTTLIAHPYVPPDGFAAAQPPVHKASTVLFADTAALRARTWKAKTGYTYGLHGTPTTFTLEARIATLEGGTETLLAPSGLAAIALVDLALLSTGDAVVLPDNAYGPSKEIARHELSHWGVLHAFYDPMQPASLASALRSLADRDGDRPGAQTRTRLVWIEAPGSVTMEFPDIAALVGVARSQGAIVALDNTWGAGIAFDAFAFGDEAAPRSVDISVQALTKYASGGGDVLMGSVTTRDDALHQRLKMAHMRIGLGVAGNDAELVLRSLPSLPLRYGAQGATGIALARWWQMRPEVERVLHPALEGSPGHANWRSLCRDAAGLFSVVFAPRYDRAQVDAFVDALEVFKIGYSWAGPVSLVVPYELATMRDSPLYPGIVVRFSIGLEDVDDLIADCERALGVLASSPAG